jgi:hypothetical protein
VSGGRAVYEWPLRALIRRSLCKSTQLGGGVSRLAAPMSREGLFPPNFGRGIHLSKLASGQPNVGPPSRCETFMC